MKWLGLVALAAAGALDLVAAGMAPAPSSPAVPSRSYLGSPAEVARIGQELEVAFSVLVSGQWRTPEEDARRREETGRRSVSDHVFGMALDVVGSPTNLDRLAAHLRTRPDVAYVLWRVPRHHGHLHVSFR